MKTNFQKVQEFHNTFGKTKDPEVPTILDDKSVIFRGKLIFEEFNEVLEELGIELDYSNYQLVQNKLSKFIDLHKLAKELADLLYVIYGTASTFGIPIDKVFAEVHRSNLSKLQSDGSVLRRDDGKILKGEQYTPADIKNIF